MINCRRLLISFVLTCVLTTFASAGDMTTMRSGDISTGKSGEMTTIKSGEMHTGVTAADIVVRTVGLYQSLLAVL